MKTEKVILDVGGRALGRAASEAAAILRGKRTNDFAPHRLPDLTLEVVNLSRVKIDPRALMRREYEHFSGYPSGLKRVLMGKALEKHGLEHIFTKTVRGMLPGNKLRAKALKLLTYRKDS